MTTGSTRDPAPIAPALGHGILQLAGGRFAVRRDHEVVDSVTLDRWLLDSQQLAIEAPGRAVAISDADAGLRVLVVDDEPGDRRLVEVMLEGVDVQLVDTLDAAGEILAADPERVAILDLRLPGFDGVQAVEHLRRRAPTSPIVVLTGYVDEQIGLRAIAAGAQDFLRKDTVGREMLLRAVRYAKQRADRERDLERRVLDDPLTGLPNRRLIRDRLQHALTKLDRAPDAGVAVLFIDLDGFKDINDVHGHQVGDQVLVAIAERLRRGVRSVDSIGRYGGDEFVAVCEGVTGGPELVAIVERLSASIARPIPLSLGTLQVQASIGAAIANRTSTVDELLTVADRAMYAAKQR